MQSAMQQVSKVRLDSDILLTAIFLRPPKLDWNIVKASVIRALNSSSNSKFGRLFFIVRTCGYK